MSTDQPKVSLVIATYQPGAGLDRVIDSLDAQTLPQDEFEVVFVDDGSPDDTFERLQALASERPNVRAFRIENSGWPSRPRNIGIEESRGEYLMFMDHDDSLFPDGLRRAYEYAVETGADLLSPKESKTNDKWWAMSSLREGNLPNVVGGDIRHILPLVPHKLYRRSLMMEHGIRFPEGSRVLWEDQFINVGVYRHSKVVAVLADTPVYLWHASATNSSHTFDPARKDFWDRLEDLMKYVRSQLSAPEHRDALVALMEMHVRVRLIDRLVALLSRGDTPASREALRRSRGLFRRFATDEVIAALPRKHQIQAGFLRSGSRSQMLAMHRYDLSRGDEVAITSVRWEDGLLQIELDIVLAPKSLLRPVLKRSEGRVLLAVPASVGGATSDELLDVTDRADDLSLALVIRSRRGHVTWNVPTRMLSSSIAATATGLGVVGRAHATIDVRAGAVGNPLQDEVWDLSAKTDWLGMARRRPAKYRGPARPSLIDGRPAVAYSNTAGELSLDLASRLRTLSTDAAPTAGPAGSDKRLSVRLRNLATDSETRYRESTLVAFLEPDEDDAASVSAETSGTELDLAIVSDGTDAFLTGDIHLPAGTYRIHARREEKLYATRHRIQVDDSGTLEWLVEV